MNETVPSVRLCHPSHMSETACLEDLAALRELARRALMEPSSLSEAEVQELAFALIVATRADLTPMHGSAVAS